MSPSLIKTLNGLFTFAWIFIILVSVVDGYLVWYFRAVIAHVEQNPAGIAMLAMAGGRVWLFLSAKSLGTILASTCLMVTYRKNAIFGIAIAVPLALFQFGLLLFLRYA
ncbi:MAG: hypothetical protein ACOVLE_16850 [Pirellula staleyi]